MQDQNLTSEDPVEIPNTCAKTFQWTIPLTICMFKQTTKAVVCIKAFQMILLFVVLFWQSVCICSEFALKYELNYIDHNAPQITDLQNAL